MSTLRPLVLLLATVLAACSSSNGASSTAVPVAVANTLTGTLVLSAATYAVAQSAGSLTVTVQRVNGAAGAAAVAYATSNGTAIAGADFTNTSGTLSWTDGDSAAKTFSVPISTGAPFSGSKSFAVTLSNPTGAALAAPDAATVTVNGSGTSAAGSVTVSAATYAVAQSAGSVTVTVDRGGGSTGAISVDYATSNATAVAGTNYTSTSGTLTWSNGDSAAKTVAVPISPAATFSGSKTFTLTLSNATGGASLGSPAAATVTINGSGASSSSGTIALSTAAFAIAQSGGSLTVTVKRSGGTGGAVGVSYKTADGSATAGADYTSNSGVLNWAAGDAAVKTFTVAVSNSTPFAGTRSFAIALSTATGGAALGTPSTATATITGGLSTTGSCAPSSNSYVTTGAFDSTLYGNYIVDNNNWGGLGGQKLWANSPSCWGVTSTTTTDNGNVGSYPSVTRGWTQNQGALQQYSTPGTNDWTTKSGMGIAVGQLTKARVHWAFTGAAPPMRWGGLMDIYFHKTTTPAATEFPPVTDLMVEQAISDQVVGTSTYFALVAAQNHATTVTIGGNPYIVFIDNPDEAGFHQAGGHNIHLFQLPTSMTSVNNNPVWGSTDAVTDVAAIVKYFMQSNPVDDAGKPLLNSGGTVVNAPLISSNLYLNSINAGWEIDDGTAFTNTAFCVALQNEPDCN